MMQSSWTSSPFDFNFDCLESYLFGVCIGLLEPPGGSIIIFQYSSLLSNTPTRRRQSRLIHVYVLLLFCNCNRIYYLFYFLIPYFMKAYDDLIQKTFQNSISNI